MRVFTRRYGIAAFTQKTSLTWDFWKIWQFVNNKKTIHWKGFFNHVTKMGVLYCIMQLKGVPLIFLKLFWNIALSGKWMIRIVLVTQYCISPASMVTLISVHLFYLKTTEDLRWIQNPTKTDFCKNLIKKRNELNLPLDKCEKLKTNI